MERGVRDADGPPAHVAEPGVERFEDHARALTAAHGRAACATGPALLALWWFTDRLVYEGSFEQRVLAEWRALLIVVGLGGLVALRRLGPRHRRVSGLLAALYLFMCAFSYFQFGRLGGAGTPWIHTACLMPLPSLLFLVEARRRLALVGAVCAVTLLAHYGPHPEHLRDPYVWNAVAMLLTSGLICVVFGDVLYRTTEDGHRHRTELARLAAFDSLTGVWRRGRFFEIAEREVARARRHGRGLCVLMLDVDAFKSVNDRHGHAAGDEVLRAVARAVGAALREHDVLARMGGEEFAVLLPETGLAEAASVAERLRRAVAASPLATPALTVTVSVGCAAARPEERSIQAALARADRALYAAKHAGRDQVRIAADPPARGAVQAVHGALPVQHEERLRSVS